MYSVISTKSICITTDTLYIIIDTEKESERKSTTEEQSPLGSRSMKVVYFNTSLSYVFLAVDMQFY